MKRVGKIICGAALSLAAVLATGCSGKDKTGSAAGSDGKKKPVITLQVYDQLANYSGEQVGWFGQIMLDKFNVKLNIIPESGNTYTTRMENKNLGDIVIWGDDSDQYHGAIKEGLLFDWDEEDLLKDYGPYISNHMKAALDKNRRISGDGKLYGFGFDVALSAKDRQSFMYTWDLRFDLYEQLGKPEIKNYDDLFNVLKKMKEICPKDDNGKDTYAVSLFPDWDGNMVMFVKSMATAYCGWDEFGFGHYDPQTGTYHPCLEKDSPYLQALKFLNRLYQAGLLNPDSQTQNFDSMSEDYKNGGAFFQIFNWMGSSLYNTDEHVNAGKAMYPVPPAEATPICYGQNVYGGNRIWSIGAKTEYPELCMEILNWLCTPEGFMTSQYGPRGVTWDYDKNGKTYFTELGEKCYTDKDTVMPAPYSGTYKDGVFNMNNTTWGLDATNPDSAGETYNCIMWDSRRTEAKSAIEKAWREWAKADSADEFMGAKKYVLAPGSMFSASSQSDELKVKWNQVATCIKTGTWRAMYASSDAAFDKIVADMTAEAKSYGYDACNEFAASDAARKKAAEDEAMRS
ncbi:MAG: extracellular solute-binding protein [Treponema sp.]|nr:extracellular solute-binding protein [Treponema sp.]